MATPFETLRILQNLRKLRIDTPRNAAFLSHLDRLLCRTRKVGSLQNPCAFLHTARPVAFW